MGFELSPPQRGAILSLAKGSAADLPADLRSKLDAMTHPVASAPEPYEMALDLMEQIRDEMKALKKTFPVVDAAAVPMEEAQRLLGCGRTAIWKLRTEGKLREAKRVGRRVMIMTDSINALLASGYTSEGAAPRARRRTGDSAVKRVRLATTRLPA